MNTIFITGAAIGIGHATASYYYAQGWSVGIADLNGAKLEEFAEGKDPTRVHLYECDVCNAEQLRAAIDDFASKHQTRLDVLVNNAGWLKVGDFMDLTVEEHHRTIEINVKGVLNGLHAAFPYLRASKGIVINLSSASSNYGVPEFSSYSASKFAVKGITEALEIEWAKYGIRVCDVVPPFVSTDMLNSQSVTARSLTHLGVNLVAGDVVGTIAKQVNRPKTHRPVGLSYGVLHFVLDIMPHIVRRSIMRLVSR